MSRLYLSMTNDEWLNLVTRAANECRTPKDQARYLLLTGLGLVAHQPVKSIKKNENDGAKDLNPQRAAAL